MCIFRFVSMRGLPAQVLGLLLLGGLLVQAADAQTSPVASVELSPVPLNLVQGRVAPNVVVTLDNSRSMFRTYSPESRPFDSGDWNGPWKCAGVIDPRITDPGDVRSRTMNSVYYNPNVQYLPPTDAVGTSFMVGLYQGRAPGEGIAYGRPRNRLLGVGSIYRYNFMGTDSGGRAPDGTSQSRIAVTELEGLRRVESVTIPYQVLVREPKTTYERIDKEVWLVGAHDRDGRLVCAQPAYAGNANQLPNRGGWGKRRCSCRPWSMGWDGDEDWFDSDNPRASPKWRGSWQGGEFVKTRDEFMLACASGSAAGVGEGGFFYRYRQIVKVSIPHTEYVERYETRYRYESKVDDQRWLCGADASSPLGDSGGPYYYRYKQYAPSITVDNQGKPDRTGLLRLYDRSHWEAVRVDDIANFANWYAYYRTPTLMMRTVLSRAFARPGAKATGGGYGSDAVRVAWQEFGSGDPFRLQDDTIIGPLMDANAPACKAASVDPAATGLQKGKVRATPNCYRSAFFNWLFEDSRFADTKLDDVNARADKFFQHGSGNTGKTGDLHDPYWEPPVKSGEDGKRLTCRQNLHLVATDKNQADSDRGNRKMYFNPGNPQNLVDRIGAALVDIAEGAAPRGNGRANDATSNISAVNTSLLTAGALGFRTGYTPSDWSGTFQAVALAANGTASKVAWDAGAILDHAGKTNPATRNILSASRNTDGSFKAGIAFKTFSNLDSAGQELLAGTPASTDTRRDTGEARLDYLRGGRSKEATTFRKRNHLLGAIVGSQAVYVGHPSSGYRESWPVNSPERKAMAGDPADCARRTPSTCRSYEAFVKNHLKRKPAVYVGANDGMLHAFDASMTKDGSGNATPTASAGQELFAYVPRSVYANLGNLTLKDGFKFMPTVDGVPVTRDVYFSQSTTTPVATSPGWRTILVGGLRLGGRGVYALDITDPASMDAGKVLWEFSADTPRQNGWSDGRAVNPGGDPANLGYTYGQPNIGRLNNGSWVVLVPGGYFPDCGKAPFAGCTTPAQVANTFSSLFVLDAQTGKLIREVKTSDARSGTNSHGLATPVLGDYNDDQVDDVAFAGDLDGNLWRYDFSSSDPAAWKVTLAFKPVTAGTQPITGMPRLYPDPATSKLIVVFGTGKYLGPQDGSDVTTQSVYGIRDIGSTVTRSQLVAQTLREATADDGKITARGLTDHAVPSNKHGWYFDLGPSASSIGERVIVTPTALFDSGRVVIQTLIPGSDPCSGGVGGALMVVNAATGGSGGGLSSLSVSAWTGSGTAAVGGRVDNPRTASGTMPVVSAVGGGSLLVPGLKLSGSDSVLSIDDAIWRRRSWRRITP